MMSAHLLFLSLFFCVVFQPERAFAEYILGYATKKELDQFPKETVLLKFPDYEYWKEVSRYLDENKGIIEFIPYDQAVQSRTELIRIQFSGKSTFAVGTSFEDILESLSENARSSKNKWKLIEKNKFDAIYESSYSDPSSNEICRMFYSKNGIHVVAFEFLKKELDPIEREKCITLLKESTKLLPFDEAACKNGLSLCDQLQNHLDFGKFKDWKVKSKQVFNSGLMSTWRVPPTHKNEEPIGAYIWVTSSLNRKGVSLEEMFETNKKTLRNEFGEDLVFEILKQSQNEIIYFYYHKKNPDQVAIIIKELITPRGYYLITYNHVGDERMSREDIHQVQEWLESVIPASSKSMNKA